MWKRARRFFFFFFFFFFLYSGKHVLLQKSHRFSQSAGAQCSAALYSQVNHTALQTACNGR